VRVVEPEPPVIVVPKSEQLIPDGVADSVTETLPVKPFAGTIVMVALVATPGLVFSIVGLAKTLKSVKLKVTNVEPTTAPPFPVTVI